MIGRFEYLVLSSATRLGNGVNGVALRENLDVVDGRLCSLGALYTTLTRLEAKGYLETWMGDPTPQRGGKRRRLVRVTEKGHSAASHF